MTRGHDTIGAGEDEPDDSRPDAIRARIGLDLHDGPLQDVAFLIGNVRALRERIVEALAAPHNVDSVLRSVDDIESAMLALDRELRLLSTSLLSSVTPERPLPQAARALVDRFQEQTGIETSLRIDGDFVRLSLLAQSAVLHVIEEALTNARKHSGASSVRIELVARDGGLHGEVVDDGAGFDVEATLLAAARAGRLGLVGMAERMRMLGGSLELDGQVGRGTRIRLSLPAGPR